MLDAPIFRLSHVIISRNAHYGMITDVWRNAVLSYSDRENVWYGIFVSRVLRVAAIVMQYLRCHHSKKYLIPDASTSKLARCVHRITTIQEQQHEHNSTHNHRYLVLCKLRRTRACSICCPSIFSRIVFQELTAMDYNMLNATGFIAILSILGLMMLIGGYFD